MTSQFKETKVEMSGAIDEILPIKCVCGHGAESWEFIISIYEEDPYACQECGREYYFTNKIKVFMKEKE